ncbi:MAG: type II toxin-antitoxin system HicA family toxin [bacterium]
MPPLPVISGRKARRALERDGWEFVRQKGSHMILVKQDFRITLSVPDHATLDRGILRDLIRDAGISVDRFIELLKK